MSDFADLKTQIMEWTKQAGFFRRARHLVYPPRFESKSSISDLRVDWMIQFDEAPLVACCCAPVPDDWLEFVSGCRLRQDPERQRRRWLSAHPLHGAIASFFNTTATWAYGYATPPRPADLHRRPSGHGRRADGQDHLLRRSARFLGCPAKLDLHQIPVALPQCGFVSGRASCCWGGAVRRQFQAAGRTKRSRSSTPTI